MRPEEVMLTALAALGLPAPERVRGVPLAPLNPLSSPPSLAQRARGHGIAFLALPACS